MKSLQEIPRKVGLFPIFQEQRRRISLQLRLHGGGCSHERTLLSLNSLLTGEKTGIFIEFRQRCLDLQSCKRCICGGLWSRERFLVLPKAGNFFMPIRELKSPIRELKWFIRELLFSARKEGKAKAKLTRSLRNAVLH